MNFLFWNLNGKSIPTPVANLAHEHDIDVLILAECKQDMVCDILLALNRPTPRKYSLAHWPPQRVDMAFLARLPHGSVEVVDYDERTCVRRLRPPVGLDVVLVHAHFPSKRYCSAHHQEQYCRRVAEMISKAEQRVGHQRTVLVGDLNMNPFECGMARANGLHGVMARQIARKGGRRVFGEFRPFFYNPMWSHFGDWPSGPPGTYYYPSSDELAYFWHMFDQVLVRPELLDRFEDGHLRIPTEAGATRLLDGSGLPDRRASSDHLPLIFALDLYKGAMNDLGEKAKPVGRPAGS
ncbi:MAG: endonuclease/exonuclease/phosphatase family protein [Planctomycetota bacterium]